VADESDSTEKAVAVLEENKFSLSYCKDGPRKVFSVDAGSRTVYVFMGDVNDLLNMECLYLMDAVVSVGEFSHINNVARIFEKPDRNSNKMIKKVKSPFTNKSLVPSEPRKTKLNRNMSILTFKVGEMKKRKLLAFYHIFKKDVKKQSKTVFESLKKFKGKSNVLYLVDHLQGKSLKVFKGMLKKYGNYSKKKLASLKYKKMKIFNK